MQRVFLYAHGGAGNHGCEAIVRSTVKIFKETGFGEISLISSRPEEDKYYGLDTICNIIPEKKQYTKISFEFIKAYLSLKLKKNYLPLDRIEYKTAFDNIKHGDIAVSIGGDNYCYADINRYIMMHEMMLKRGAVTILWGCSVEPDIVKRPEVSYDLAKYSLITARESISYNALRRVNENTMLLPDPAFLLESVPLKPTAGYDIKNMVGINLSPMVMENESIQGITIANYQNTIEYILDETDMGIALIPHVVWQEGDDRIPLRLLYDKYKKSGRIMFVEDHNCMELKGIIAQCRFFIGARTHATIAAYSSGIPTLVVGYSVKARGIAKDLFGKEDGYVIPVQLLKHEDDIKTELKKIIGRENEIRKALKKQKKYVEMYRKE